MYFGKKTHEKLGLKHNTGNISSNESASGWNMSLIKSDFLAIIEMFFIVKNKNCRQNAWSGTKN